jgi:hypothetical protein
MSRMISICFTLFLLISILTSSYGQVTCASGWYQYGGSCYLFNPAFNSGNNVGYWDKCHAYCPTSYPGATMICVNNAAENDWIRTKFGYLVGDRFLWIGYTDMPPYGGGKGTQQYGWVTGCSSTYTDWLPGQPDNSNNNEDYAALRVQNGWYDLYPNDQWHCGCEYTPALTTTPSSRPTTAPSSHPSTAPSSRPSTVPSSGSTSSPTATPSFSSSVGDVSE